MNAIYSYLYIILPLIIILNAGDCKSIYDQVREELQEISNRSSVDDLLSAVLNRTNCIRDKNNCQLNIAGNLSNIIGHSSLNQSNFGQISVILVVLARNIRNCKAIDALFDSAQYNAFLRAFSEKTGLVKKISNSSLTTLKHLDANAVETLIDSVRQNYCPRNWVRDSKGTLYSDLSIKLKCVTTDELLKIIELKTISKAEDYEKLSSIVILNVIKGNCFSINDVAPLHNILSWIFEKYGDKRYMDHKGLGELMKKLNIGQTAVTSSDDHVEAVHSRKKRHGDETHDDETGDDDFRCYTQMELMENYFGKENVILDVAKFEKFCPAIIQQIASDVCKNIKKDYGSSPSDAEVYGFGTLAIVIISICTILAAPLMTIKNERVKNYIIAVLVALGMGTLCGDAALHLIPLSLGLHDHAKHGDDIADGIEIKPYVWKMFAFLSSIYALFVLETILAIFNKGQHGHSHDSSISMDNIPNVSVNGEQSKDVDVEFEEKQTFSAMSIMVLLGDSLHNMADGIAIGAAFSVSISGGVSTAIAIFFHELPHELGDFAVLISSGLNIKRAMLMNVVSGILAFVGLYSGIAISKVGNPDLTRQWIFTVTAGMFIYLSLSSIVPELKDLVRKAESKTTMRIVQHAGLVFGIGSMLIIAIFEIYIKI